MKYLLAGCVIAGLLAGCAPGTEYRQAETLPPLKNPEDAQLHGVDPMYRVPEEKKRALYSEGEHFQVPKPPQLVPVPNPDEESTPAPKEKVAAELGEDGNGFPIIMIHTQYAWAWEYVAQALDKTDLDIDDRNREIGIYYLDVPSRYDTPDDQVRVKLSRTANGIQVTVLGPEEEALLDRKPGRAILQRIYDEL